MAQPRLIEFDGNGNVWTVGVDDPNTLVLQSTHGELIWSRTFDSRVNDVERGPDGTIFVALEDIIGVGGLLRFQP